MSLNTEDYRGPVYGNQEQEMVEVEGTPLNIPGNKDKEKKRNRKQKQKSSGENPIVAFFTDKRFRIVFGTILMLSAIFLLISGISYFAYGAADQSLVTAHPILANAESNNIKNYGGPLGAFLSEFFFNQGFGIGTFFLIYMLAALSLKVFGKYKYRTSSTILISMVAMVTVSSLFGFLDVEMGSLTFFAVGGAHGHYLNQFCESVAGPFGCIALNILLLVILIALTINSLMHIYQCVKELIANYRLKQLQKKHEQEIERRNTFDESDNEKKPEEKAAPQKEHRGIAFKHDDVEVAESEPVEAEVFEAVAEPETPSAAPVITDQPRPAEAPAEAVEMKEIEKADNIAEKPFDPTAELSKYKFPPTSLLRDIPDTGKSVDVDEQEENKATITKTLSDYGIEIRSIEVCVGPTVTLYEIIPAEGVRISKIKNLEDDIALSLSALGIRIIAPIPGKGTIGIEVPNKDKRTVSMRDVIESKKFQDCKYELPIAMGCTISNDVFIADLAKMPHILVAGATGMGKSVGLNAIVTSLLYKKHPSELKFVMIDPKMVEFSMYSKLEYHYIAKMEGEDECIVTDMNKAVATLKSLVAEMENRLLLLRDANVRNIKEYNTKFIQRRLNPEKGHKFMPYIVVIIDELADLIMNIGRKEVEIPISRITQKARAVGIHMILATQRPSTDIITGVIKANCPGRIAFRVTQMVDSRTILDRSGAQQLIGRGDMLISYNNEITRVQCAFVDTPEVEAIANYIDEQVGFDSAYMLPEYTPDMEGGNNSGGQGGGLGSISDRDSLFEEVAKQLVNGELNPSTSGIQRRYSIGYNRAGRLMDQLEAAGIVSASQGGKPRQVLMDPINLQSLLDN